MSHVDIFLSTSQKRSKTHVVTKSLYIEIWFVCSNRFECLKNVETFLTKNVLSSVFKYCEREEVCGERLFVHAAAAFLQEQTSRNKRSSNMHAACARHSW